MNDDKKARDNFIIKLTDDCGLYDDWISVVRFGLPTLLDDGELLGKVLYRRAAREAREAMSRRDTDEALCWLMRDLGLKFTTHESEAAR